MSTGKANAVGPTLKNFFIKISKIMHLILASNLVNNTKKI